MPKEAKDYKVYSEWEGYQTSHKIDTLIPIYCHNLYILVIIIIYARLFYNVVERCNFS